MNERSMLGWTLQFIAALGALAVPVGVCALVYLRRRRSEPRGFDVLPQKQAGTVDEPKGEPR